MSKFCQLKNVPYREKCIPIEMYIPAEIPRERSHYARHHRNKNLAEAYPLLTLAIICSTCAIGV